MILLLNRAREMIVLSVWEINVTQDLDSSRANLAHETGTGAHQPKENVFHRHFTALQVGVSSLQA